ncbi:MAG: hypothetical protein ACI4S0_10460 [Dorea sp.]
MTDNEKRAHDLALSYFKDVIQSKIDEAARETYVDGEVTTGSSVDIYQAYKMIYDSALEALNRDYPNGR